MAILSIQSHVVYGFVGNKAATFPLQTMGIDVWPINTVQFSNHTGYGKWRGQIMSGAHLQEVIDALFELGVLDQCEAVISGYIGSREIGEVIYSNVERIKQHKNDVIYLCDPVIGDFGRGVFVKPEVEEFFKGALGGDIVTPNHFEAELLTGINIDSLQSAAKACNAIHERGIKTVVITSLRLPDKKDQINILLSEDGELHLVSHQLYDFAVSPNGTGDLFAAVFIGNYLRSKTFKTALELSAKQVHSVMKATHEVGGRELAVLSFRL